MSCRSSCSSGALVLIDSYKLVAFRAILLSVAAGVVAGLASYAVNVSLRPALALDLAPYSRYVAPVVEESFKAAFVVFLLQRNRVGFVVDAAIHGFAIGTGFAVLENLYYVRGGRGRHAVDLDRAGVRHRRSCTGAPRPSWR